MMAQLTSLKRLEQLFLFLSILFLPTQLGRHFWFDSSYIYSLKIDYLSFVVYFWDLVVLTLFSLALINNKVLNKTALSLGMLFILSQLVSLLGAVNFWGGVFKIEQYLIAILFGVYLASCNLQLISKKIIWGLGVGVVFEGLLGLVQVLKGGSVGFWILGERTFDLSTLSIATFNFYGEIFLRAYGTFPHPNVLAAFMAISIPLILYFPVNPLVKIICYIISFGTVLLTFSRSVLVVFFLESFYFIASYRKYILITLLILSPFVATRFFSAFNFDYLSIDRRLDLNEVGITLFMKHPLLGVGANNFLNQVSTTDLISGPSRFLQPIHNIFLLILTESGVVGFACFALLVGLPFYQVFKDRRNKFKGLILMEFLIILTLGLTDHYFVTLAQGIRMLFLIWGLSMIELKND